MVVNSEDGRALRSFIKMKIKRSVRAVERVLPETLASELPPETVQFSSKLANIKSRENDDTLSELTDGTGFLAKMSFSEPKYTGHYAFCGLGFYFNGQPYAANINHIYGRGLHAGYVPVSTTKDYCTKITEVLLRKQAKELVNWPEELIRLIDLSPDETISKTPIVDS
ncbi:hypothetical protein V6N11_035309 [Hibiscus sabdariffa]|uniref:Uncharacterized protein n=1 Tax=Hibiscus sabdariffa TaxID=183260 RepID=A0ABR2R0F9_9ROSI